MAAVFDLAIEALGGDRYRVSVTESPAGSASAEIDAPTTFAELAELGDVLGDRAGVSPSEQADAARAFGEKLYGAIFSGLILDAYTTSLTSQPGGLTIRLNLAKAGLLQNVPWSLLRAPKSNAQIPVTMPDLPTMPGGVGGLRETASGPRLVLLIALLFVIGAAAFGLTRLPSNPLNPTPSDVDLTVVSLRFLPPHPAPGQPVTVAITIRNIGTTESPPFNWIWYRGDAPNENAKTDLSDMAPSLAPNTNITVKGEFVPGWWGDLYTTAFVNPDGKVQEKTLINNFNKPEAGHISTSRQPFLIDFTLLPDGSRLLESRDLKGDEFNAWKLTMQVDASGSQTCSKAILKLLVAGEGNQLTTGLPGSATASPDCANLPVLFTLADSIGGASIDFSAEATGQYEIDLLDASGKLLDKTTAQVDAPGSQTLKVSSSDTPLNVSDGAAQIVFRGPGRTVVQRLTLNIPGG